MKKSSLLYLLTFLLIRTIAAQQSSGTIQVSLDSELMKVSKESRLSLWETSSLTEVQTAIHRADGTYSFYSVPFGTYDLELRNGAEIIASRRVALNSAVPLNIILTFQKTYEMNPITVNSSLLDRNAGAPSSVVTAKQIDAFPVISDSKKIEAVLLNTPGVVPDEDGRMHIRGEDAQIQYIIDGIPVSGNLTRVYSSLFNANSIKTANIQTGDFNAEYGVANAAIVVINTKSGFDAPSIADAHASIGSFNSKSGDLELGGALSGNSAFFMNVTSSSSDRYLDPISSPEPNHSFGKNLSFFGKVDAAVSPKIQLHFLSAFNSTEFEIPNFNTNSPQDQKQEMNDYILGARMNYTPDTRSIFSLLVYTRHAKMDFTSSGIKKLLNQTDYDQATAENEKMFVGAERMNEYNGAQAEYSTMRNIFKLDHNIKAGINAEFIPLHEYFTFAVTNPALSDTNNPGGDIRLLPYDLTQKGKPFLVDQGKRASRYSAYIQDQFQIGDKWLLSAGIRYDSYSLFDTESALSPRFSLSYQVNNDLLLRISYNRIFMQAPLENILVSSSAAARSLTGAEQGSTPSIVKSEYAHVMELGGSYRLSDKINLELLGYTKLIDNFLVKVELGNSGIIFPANLKNGLVAGGEFKATLHNWNNIYASLSVSTCVSLGIIPSDGSSPFGAGLVLGEEGYNYSHPFKEEDTFPTEHNQLVTAVLQTKYISPEGFFVYLNGRFDSGLPFDLAGKDGVGLDEQASVAELKSRGYSDQVINLLSLTPEKPGSPDKSLAPRVLFDLGIGYDLKDLISFPISVSAGIINVFDTIYLYKFESTFGGTHFGTPRMFSLSVKADI